jgi:hypothetical protein
MITAKGSPNTRPTLEFCPFASAFQRSGIAMDGVNFGHCLQKPDVRWNRRIHSGVQSAAASNLAPLRIQKGDGVTFSSAPFWASSL